WVEAEHAVDHTVPDPVRRGPGVRLRGAAEHLEVGPVGPGERSGDNPGLPHAGGGRELHRHPTAEPGVHDRLAEHGDFRLTADRALLALVVAGRRDAAAHVGQKLMDLDGLEAALELPGSMRPEGERVLAG